MAGINNLCAAAGGVKVVDNSLVSGQVSPAACKLRKADNFLVLKSDLFDHLHGALLDDGDEALLATDAEEVWLDVPDIGDPL